MRPTTRRKARHAAKSLPSCPSTPSACSVWHRWCAVPSRGAGGFGDAPEALAVFVENEIRPLMNPCRGLNEWSGEELVRFRADTRRPRRGRLGVTRNYGVGSSPARYRCYGILMPLKRPRSFRSFLGPWIPLKLPKSAIGL